MKLLIALNNNNGVYSKLSEHFGHCLYFAIYNTDTKELDFIDNFIDHSNHLNNTLTPVDQVMKFNPDIIFSLGVGKKALKLFAEKGIKVKTGNFKILKEVIENINNLSDSLDGCDH
jgi:predicted Fe-Mo cluster-binding NifX family protein